MIEFLSAHAPRSQLAVTAGQSVTHDPTQIKREN